MKSVGETLENVCRRTFNSHPLQSVHLQCKSYCMQKTSRLVNTNVPTRVQSTRKFNSIRSRQTNGHDASLNYVLAFFFEKKTGTDERHHLAATHDVRERNVERRLLDHPSRFFCADCRLKIAWYHPLARQKTHSVSERLKVSPSCIWVWFSNVCRLRNFLLKSK